MYCVNGNSSWYINCRPLFGGCPLLGVSVIGGSTVLPTLPLFVYNNIYVAACIFVCQECCTSMPYTFLHVFVCWRGCEYVHQVTISPSKALLGVSRNRLKSLLYAPAGSTHDHGWQTYSRSQRTVWASL